MTVFAAIAFATFLFENDYFVSFYEGFFDLADNFCALNDGCADFDFSFVVNEEYAVKFYGVTLFDCVGEAVNIKEAVFFCFELLPLDFNNYVHYLIYKYVNPSGGLRSCIARFGKCDAKVRILIEPQTHRRCVCVIFKII